MTKQGGKGGGFFTAAALVITATLLIALRYTTALVWWQIAILSLGATGFVLTAYDKGAAGGPSRQRVPESLLIGMAALGAWPGIIGAMLLLRHKVRKGRFCLRLSAVVLLHLLFLGLAVR